MTSFPEVVMYVRFRWPQFIKYMVLRTQNFSKQSFINRAN